MKNKLNYYMPAEWELHERTLIEWPVKESLVWSENHKEVLNGYANVANAISDLNLSIGVEESNWAFLRLCIN